MDTMSVGVAVGRSAGPVAVARDSARHLLEGLVPAPVSEPADTVILVVSEDFRSRGVPLVGRR